LSGETGAALHPSGGGASPGRHREEQDSIVRHLEQAEADAADRRPESERPDARAEGAERRQEQARRQRRSAGRAEGGAAAMRCEAGGDDAGRSDAHRPAGEDKPRDADTATERQLEVKRQGEKADRLADEAADGGEGRDTERPPGEEVRRQERRFGSSAAAGEQDREEGGRRSGRGGDGRTRGHLLGSREKERGRGDVESDAAQIERAPGPLHVREPGAGGEREGGDGQLGEQEPGP